MIASSYHPLQLAQTELFLGGGWMEQVGRYRGLFKLLHQVCTSQTTPFYFFTTQALFLVESRPPKLID